MKLQLANLEVRLRVLAPFLVGLRLGFYPHLLFVHRVTQDLVGNILFVGLLFYPRSRPGYSNNPIYFP